MKCFHIFICCVTVLTSKAFIYTSCILKFQKYILKRKEIQTLVIHNDILGECVSFRIIVMLTSTISFQTPQQH